jgi:hypothetical protein
MFNYFYLSNVQKVTISVTTILFMILILFLRPILLDTELHSLRILTFTLLFFALYGLTQILTNSFTYEYLYRGILKP